MLAPRVDLGDGFVRDTGMEGVALSGGFTLPAETYDRMFVHQREGVAWLWGLHQRQHGGILGDDMVCVSTLSNLCTCC